MTADHARRAILARDRLRRVEDCRPPDPAPEPEPEPKPALEETPPRD